VLPRNVDSFLIEINHETLIFLNSLKEEVPEFFYRYASEILGITSPTSLMIFTHAFESKRYVC